MCIYISCVVSFFFLFVCLFCFMPACLFYLPVSFLKREKKKAWCWKGGDDLGVDERGKPLIRIYCRTKLT